MLRRACVAAMPSAAHRLGETVPAALRSGARPAVVANPRGVPNAAVVQHTLAAYAAGGAPAAPADLPPHDLVGAFLRAVDRLDDAIAEPVERRAARDAYLGAMLKAALRVATTMAAQPVRGSGRGGRPTAGTPTQTRAPGSGRRGRICRRGRAWRRLARRRRRPRAASAAGRRRPLGRRRPQ